MRILKRIALFLALALTALWANNTSLFTKIDPNQQPKLLAHRGVHQIYAGPDRTAETCTANPVIQNTHSLIANTIPSMKAAFDHGADVVEIDVHLTTDSTFAVFHDWRLDCQTNGTGVTHKQDFATLKTLDLGHGYSVDGKTFPLRGTAIGAMPSLTEVLNADLPGRFLINFKSNDGNDGKAMAYFLDNTPLSHKVLGVYGGAHPTRVTLNVSPDLKGFDRQTLKLCLQNYMLVGWSGFVPEACQNRLIAIPMDYAPYLWGWPHKFTKRMKANGTKVILWGPYDGSGFSSGIDDAETLAQVPTQFDGYIWTNRIEIIGPLMTD